MKNENGSQEKRLETHTERDLGALMVPGGLDVCEGQIRLERTEVRVAPSRGGPRLPRPRVLQTIMRS